MQTRRLGGSQIGRSPKFSRFHLFNYLKFSVTSSFERVVQTTSWPHKISGEMLRSHSVVSSSRTVRPCSPWGGWWIGHWRTTWSTVCSSAQHPQEAIPHLYKQEWKHPTPARRRLSRTHSVLQRVIPGGCQYRG